MKNWKILSKKNILDSKWLRVDKEVCQLPNCKVISDFYTLWQPDWVLILAKNFQGKWVLASQYRHGTQKTSLEFPAGIIDSGETPIDAAKRELQEECAYAKGNWTLIGELPMNPDRHRGRFFVVYAEGVEKFQETRFDDSENIETVLIETEVLLEKIKKGTFVHPHQIAGFYLWQLKQS